MGVSLTDALASPLLAAGAQGAFSAAATRAQRRWSEKMYLKYNSPAALVRQYQEAGINPALMFGQSTPAAPTESSASAMPDNPVGDVVGLLGQLMELDMLDANKRNIEAEIANKEVNTKSKSLENDIKERFGMLTAEASYNEILQRINDLRASATLTDYQRSVLGPLEEALKQAEKEKLSSETVYQNWINGFIKEHGSDPTAQPILQLISSLMDNNKLDRPDRSGRKSIGSSKNGGGSR